MKGIESKRKVGHLTEREKILLGILGILLVWTGAVRLVIGPAGKEIEELRRTMAAEKERRAEMAAYVRQADLLSEYRDRPDQAEDFFYIGLDSAFIDSDLQALAAEAGVEIWKLESREPVTEQDGVFEVHVLLDIRCGNMDALSRMAGEIDRREKSVFLKALSAEENEEGMLEGRMEVVYCYAEEKPQGRTGVHTD